MRVAVTGGSGHVGPVMIAEFLAAGFDVRSVDHAAPSETRCEHVEADLTDHKSTIEALRGCDGVVHLAAIRTPIGYPPQVVYANNVVSNYNVLQAAVELGIRKVCLASSVNAIGQTFSREMTYDYFPIDEKHVTRAEDPYSLSKWCGEQQADAVARLHPEMTLASFRYSGMTPPGQYQGWRDAAPRDPAAAYHDLWGYVDMREGARAHRLAHEADWTGHEVFLLTARDTTVDTPTLELVRQYFPHAEIRGDLPGTCSVYDCSKAAHYLDWVHELSWRDVEDPGTKNQDADVRT